MIPDETQQGTTPGTEGGAAPVETMPGAPDPATLLAAKDEETRGLIDRLKRLQAEFDNYRKRVLRDVAAIEERTSDREILAFLPLYDNLERAFAAYAKDGIAADFVAGVERIFGQFAQILDQKGVGRIATVGERFDPSQHEALMSMHSPLDKNVILEEFSPGYTRGDRTLEPSKVSVSQGPAPKGEEET